VLSVHGTIDMWVMWKEQRRYELYGSGYGYIGEAKFDCRERRNVVTTDDEGTILAVEALAEHCAQQLNVGEWRPKRKRSERCSRLIPESKISRKSLRKKHAGLN
jgi:hypothetical protein